jgi:hypothetical protein
MLNPRQFFQRFFLFSGGFLTLILVLVSSQAMGGEECQELVRNKCSTCHFVKYICPKIEKGKGTLSWKWTLHDMVKEGLVATDQEQDRLVSCLADPDAKVKALCSEKK